MTIILKLSSVYKTQPMIPVRELTRAKLHPHTRKRCFPEKLYEDTLRASPWNFSLKGMDSEEDAVVRRDVSRYST